MSDTPNKDVLCLIVDDDQTNRFVLETILSNADYQVVSVEDGEKAIQKCEEIHPDIILMDVVMPNMDGYEATKIIKEKSGDHFIPVIFLTALSDENALAKCVEAGGDDFLTKPYNQTILQAKIDAMLRIRNLYSTMQQQKTELAKFNEHIKREHDTAEKLFSNIAHSGCLDAEYIKYLLSPMAVFNGDLLLAAHKPSGGLNVMLGDFTGHGLPAAVGALPVSEIFYEMTAKGYAINDIIKETNSKLQQVLTTNIFCAACIVEIDLLNNTLAVWNGGIPSVYIKKAATGKIIRLQSSNLPLGIVDNDRLKTSLEMHEINEGDKIYISSDGVIESTNAQEEMFGTERLENILSDTANTDIFHKLLAELDEFRGKRQQTDDTTLIEIKCNNALATHQHSGIKEKFSSRQPASWKMHLDFDSEILKSTDPLPFILQAVTEIQGLYQIRSRLFSIISELYSNALDHGILGLSSELKKSPEGFVEYYSLREEKLRNLESEWIKLTIEHKPNVDGGELRIHITDSGDGFDFANTKNDIDTNEGLSGRGIPLVRSLCRQLEYQGKGNEVIAIYEWQQNSKTH